MESGSNGTSCMMAFGENNYGLCPVMMMPLMTSHGHHHPNADTNSLLLPLPPTNNNDQNQNRNTSNTSSFVFHDQNNNSNTGCYFMENNNSNIQSSSSAEKVKIMAHPHYQRLLAAYVNCQKVKRTQFLTRINSVIITHQPKTTTLSIVFNSLPTSSCSLSFMTSTRK